MISAEGLEEDKITGQVRQTLEVFALSCNSVEARVVGVIILAIFSPFLHHFRKTSFPCVYCLTV